MTVWAALQAGGNYAAYIWPAYGVSALGLGLAVIVTLKAWRDARTRLAALEQRLQDRDGAKP